MQTELNFLHSKENNRESQLHLEDNCYHFDGQCLKVYELLKNGFRLSVIEAMNFTPRIMSLPRRIKDLRDRGIIIHDEWVIVNGKKTYKEYYLKPEIK